MNSLPFISHHLFVAAIGNEDRVRELPTRREGSSVEAVGLASAIGSKEMDGRKPFPAEAARPLGSFVAQAQS